MKKTVILIGVLVLIVVLGTATYKIIQNRENNVENTIVIDGESGKNQNTAVSNTDTAEIKDNETGKVDIILTGDDIIAKDSSWCGTFQLIWNDLKNDLAKQDIIFDEQPVEVDNLNKGKFTVDDISESSYYKTYGAPTLELKEKIEKAIKEKFNEKSDILDSFEWKEEESADYFLYAMLKKDFKFAVEFSDIPYGEFNDVKNVKFFGITPGEKTDASKQIEVLYYDSEDSFAVKLLAEDDEVIICKGSNEQTFNKIYNTMIEKAEEYDGKRTFDDGVDGLRVPNIKFDADKEFEVLENKLFYFSNGDPYEITQTLQTIKFDLDKTGVEIKSEAGMMATLRAMEPEDEEKPEPRLFYADSSFTIFLKEAGKEKPYFSAHIDDITKYQDIEKL